MSSDRRNTFVIPQLHAAVQAVLDHEHSPQQISNRPPRDHPGWSEWQVSHETIYPAVYIQGRKRTVIPRVACTHE
ncbi:hypothetical protein [Actinoplanes sp. NPDC020271]|uniref:hypothetical protein n=1 Tax=Actinoplanes sp. NPDC020271 TaxID=3363896 RepID=UPI00379B3D9A